MLSAEAAGGALAVVVGLALGVAFASIAARAGEGWVLFTLYLVALEAGLAALVDLRTLIGLSAKSAERVTDARAMAEITFLPALFWAGLWAIAASAILAAALRLAWNGRSR